jgi:hypothetical protein
MAALIESFPSYANRARWQQRDRPAAAPPPDRVILAGSLDSTPVSWPEVLPRVNLGRPRRVFFATWERSGTGEDFQRIYWAVFQPEGNTWSLANLAYQVRYSVSGAEPQPIAAAQTSPDAIAIQAWLRDCQRVAGSGS